jgi:hypothetical protein
MSMAPVKASISVSLDPSNDAVYYDIEKAVEAFLEDKIRTILQAHGVPDTKIKIKMEWDVKGLTH